MHESTVIHNRAVEELKHINEWNVVQKVTREGPKLNWQASRAYDSQFLPLKIG